MARLKAIPRDLANFLLSYGEEELADRVFTASDEDLDRIAVLGGHYAFSDVALENGGSIGGGRALSLAALDVLDGTRTELLRTRTDGELAAGLAPELTPEELHLIQIVRTTAPAHKRDAHELQRIRIVRSTGKHYRDVA